MIPQEYLEHPGVAHLLTLLADADFKRELSKQPGYDARETGVIQYETQ